MKTVTDEPEGRPTELAMLVLIAAAAARDNNLRAPKFINLRGTYRGRIHVEIATPAEWSLWAEALGLTMRTPMLYTAGSEGGRRRVALDAEGTWRGYTVVVAADVDIEEDAYESTDPATSALIDALLAPVVALVDELAASVTS